MRQFLLRGTTLEVLPPFEKVPLAKDEDSLGLSIQKWEAIVHFLEEGCYPILGGGKSTCALCQKYVGCADCPIPEPEAANELAHYGCAGTPYYEWINADDRGAALTAAHKEVKFLKELRNKHILRFGLATSE